MPVKITKKAKMRDLLCFALNKILEVGGIDLNNPKQEITKNAIETVILGKKSKISWISIGYGEVMITVWWGLQSKCIDSEGRRPLNRNLKDAVEVCCSGWLERKDGAWLQGFGGDFIFDTYCSKDSITDLYSIPVVASNGFEKEGKGYY